MSATANGVAKAEPQPKLVVRNLTVFYGEKKAVGPVAMDIVEQHVTTLIGPSGCGNSTFLSSLTLTSCAARPVSCFAPQSPASRRR